MNTPIRRLGFVVAALFCSVLLAASYIQVLQAKSLKLGLKFKQMDEKAADEHAELRDRHPLSLSGGQKQLLALASVFVTDPAIIVADEPTTLLDLRNTRMLADVFATLDEQVVVVSHDLDILADFDRVIVIDEGRVVVDDEPRPALAAYRGMMS